MKRHVASNPLPASRERRIAPGVAANGRRAARQGALFKTQTLFLWLPHFTPSPPIPLSILSLLLTAQLLSSSKVGLHPLLLT